MKFSTALSLALFAASPSVNAFTTTTCPSATLRGSTSLNDSPFFSTDIAKSLDKEVSYSQQTQHVLCRDQEHGVKFLQ